jgi:ubiquinone biosynthesis protein UbiJ
VTTEPEGKDVAQKGNQTMAGDYGQRAATALDLLITGPHRDKTVARLFGVSVRMAKYLRAGQYWTSERLTQASGVLGAAFDAALISPSSSAQHYAEMADIADRLARLEARFEEVARREDAGLASPQGDEADRRGRISRPGNAPADRGGPRA